MNVHKRCQKNVANNCGIDVKQLSAILAAMGIRPQNEAKRKKSVSMEETSNLAILYNILSILYMFLCTQTTITYQESVWLQQGLLDASQAWKWYIRRQKTSI